MKLAIIVTLVVIILSSCVPVITPIATKTSFSTYPYTPVTTPINFSTPVPSLTATPILATEIPTQLKLTPTQMTLTVMAETQEWTSPFLTPVPAELEQWEEYEKALGDAFFEKDRIPATDIICEWRIVERVERKTFMIVACSGVSDLVSKQIFSFSLPTVVYLGEKGEIQRVGTPENTSGNSYGDVRRKLFPPSILEKFEHMPSHHILFEHLVHSQVLRDG